MSTPARSPNTGHDMHQGGPSLPLCEAGVAVAATMARKPIAVSNAGNDGLRVLIVRITRIGTAASRRSDRLTARDTVTGHKGVRRSYAGAVQRIANRKYARSPLRRRNAIKANPAKAGDAKLRGYRGQQSSATPVGPPN